MGRGKGNLLCRRKGRRLARVNVVQEEGRGKGVFGQLWGERVNSRLSRGWGGKKGRNTMPFGPWERRKGEGQSALNALGEKLTSCCLTARRTERVGGADAEGGKLTSFKEGDARLFSWWGEKGVRLRARRLGKGWGKPGGKERVLKNLKEGRWSYAS